MGNKLSIKTIVAIGIGAAVFMIFLGAIFIALIAAAPIIFTAVTGLPETVRLGGTSILIAVGVVLETYKQLESSVASRAYRR